MFATTVPLAESPAGRYLAGRGIEIDTDDLRFSPNCDARPALVCLVRNLATGEPQAIQRIYLDGITDPVCKAKMPDGTSPKRSLGPTRNGAVIFGDIVASDTIVECEGPETAASIFRRSCSPTWAA